MTEVGRLAAELVRIPSVNPALDPSGTGETAIARYVASRCEARGLDVEWLEPHPGRPSVIVRARGRAGGPTLLLNAHLDTVGVAGMDAPFEPRVTEGRLRGRGAVDMKGSLAACLLVVERAARSDLPGTVVLTAVADEEHDSIGTRAALEAVPDADLAVVTEPTDLALHVAHRGFAVVDVAFEGRPSHTSRPEQGVNALTHLARLLAEIERADGRLRDAPPHRLLGHGAWQAVLARGGQELFTTPASAHASLERRTLPGEASETAAQEATAMIEALRGDDATIRATVRTGVAREAFEADVGGLAARAVAAAEAATGRRPNVAGAPYWTDAALVAAAGIPTVLYGPVGGGLHRADEWLDLASLDTFHDVLGRLVADVCG